MVELPRGTCTPFAPALIEKYEDFQVLMKKRELLLRGARPALIDGYRSAVRHRWVGNGVNEWGDSLGNRTPDLSQTALHYGQVGHTAALCTPGGLGE